MLASLKPEKTRTGGWSRMWKWLMLDGELGPLGMGGGGGGQCVGSKTSSSPLGEEEVRARSSSLDTVTPPLRRLTNRGR